MDEASPSQIFMGIIFGLVILCFIVLAGMWGCPQWNVYASRLSGEAKLREAESSRKIAIQEAEAKKVSAEYLADAEIARARGVAEANKIIGEGLKDHEEYLLYLWIQTLGDKDNHVIYIPTEGQIPILEAGRFRSLESQKSKKIEDK